MNLGDLKDYVFSIVNKDETGRAITEEDFNLYLEIVNNEMFNSEWMKLIQASADLNIPVNELLSTTTQLNEFKVVSLITPSGYVNLPSNYRYYSSVLWIKGSVSKRLSVVDEKKFDSAYYNMLNRNPNDYPLGKIYDNKMSIMPNDADYIKLSYIKEPNTPYYDYCVKTTNNNIVFMPVSSYITGTTLYAQGGSTLSTDVVHLSGNASSATVELEWRADVHNSIAHMIADKFIQKINDGERYQINTVEKQG